MKSHNDSQIFTNEDLSKAENRVNVALFGLMPQDWFREWFLENLDLPLDSIVYPRTNVREMRPDLTVETLDGSTIAWIEVELGTNPGQLKDYCERYDESVKSVCGKRNDGGDLSLEQIRDFLSERIGSLPLQTEVNVRHLRKLIDEGLYGHSRSGGKRTGVQVSAEIRAHPLVAGLEDQLKNKLVFGTGRVGPGQLRADAMKGHEKDGFSLYGFSSVHDDGVAFLLNLSGGSQTMQFPTILHLEKYWPHNPVASKEYAALLNRMGLNINKDHDQWNAGSRHVDVVLPYLDDLAKCVLAFVDSD